VGRSFGSIAVPSDNGYSIDNTDNSGRVKCRHEQVAEIWRTVASSSTIKIVALADPVAFLISPDSRHHRGSI
jgi:hypothetical protein